MTKLSRRAFLAAAGSVVALAKTTQIESKGFFTLGHRRGRWWFLTPEGKPFFSIGLNHIDSAALRFAENSDRWRGRYRNSQRKWLQESVRPNLLDWGFNTVGWVQEVVTRGTRNHRHSQNFTYEEYQWLDMPYCHMLPFADFHQWEAEVRHPDLMSEDFENWCDYVAREHCARFRDDAKLIGYWYLDCPTWVHTRRENEWKGPMFDSVRLKTEAGREELLGLATRYYKVCHDAIRRYDPHHLILGDRYEANAPLPMEVVRAALPFVDVLSFQDFRRPVEHLAQWHEKTGKPVLWADGAKGQTVDGEPYTKNDGTWWAKILAGLQENPGCVGAHLCGAYIRNNVRRRGLLDPRETPDSENIELIRRANQEMAAFAAEAG